MRALLFLITLLFLSCGTDQGSTDTYTYTARNESGVLIKILAYNTFSVTPEEVIFTTILKNGDEITKKYQDGLPPRRYRYSDFFGKAKGGSVADSIKVIYNNLKYKGFNSKNCTGGERNPLNTCTYQSTEETFIFTVEDYESAEDCNGNCD